MSRHLRGVRPRTWLSFALSMMWLTAFVGARVGSFAGPASVEISPTAVESSAARSAGVVKAGVNTALEASPAPEQNAPATTTPRKAVDWVALNPGFAGATFVNDVEVCAGCHEDAVKAYSQTKHFDVFGLSAPSGSYGCETCHGPQSRHVDNPDDPTRELVIDPASTKHSGICLQCHEGGARVSWKSGAHHTGEVGCASCHDVMAKKSERALLVKPTVGETCYQCHAEVRADMSKMSHHPVREGKMDCASCHNVHGAAAALLLKPTVSDTCATCHAEKRGPFVWEHAPVRETCSNCHTPHGSNQRNLLTGKDAFLCLSCHSYGGHINLPRYNRVSNPYGSGCVNCHITTHGTNHPSGAKFTR